MFLSFTSIYIFCWFFLLCQKYTYFCWFWCESPDTFVVFFYCFFYIYLQLISFCAVTQCGFLLLYFSLDSAVVLLQHKEINKRVKKSLQNLQFEHRELQMKLKFPMGWRRIAIWATTLVGAVIIFAFMFHFAQIQMFPFRQHFSSLSLFHTFCKVISSWARWDMRTASLDWVISRDLTVGMI